MTRREETKLRMRWRRALRAYESGQIGREIVALHRDGRTREEIRAAVDRAVVPALLLAHHDTVLVARVCMLEWIDELLPQGGSP